jgi:hypothetical protein
MPAAFYGTPAAFCGRRLLAAGCAEVIRRQARPLPEAQSQSTAQVGQIERGLAIAAKGSPEEREERLVLVDWQGLPRAQRPSAGCEIEAEGLDHRYKWIRHSPSPHSIPRCRDLASVARRKDPLQRNAEIQGEVRLEVVVWLPSTWSGG